jgi:hypothetical protein
LLLTNSGSESVERVKNGAAASSYVGEGAAEGTKPHGCCSGAHCEEHKYREDRLTAAHYACPRAAALTKSNGRSLRHSTAHSTAPHRTAHSKAQAVGERSKVKCSAGEEEVIRYATNAVECTAVVSPGSQSDFIFAMQNAHSSTYIVHVHDVHDVAGKSRVTGVPQLIIITTYMYIYNNC